MKCIECYNTEINYTYVFCEKCYKRMKRGGGSVAPSGCADAKRTATRGAKDLPQTAAVAPGEAEALLRKWRERAAGTWNMSSANAGSPTQVSLWDYYRSQAAVLEKCIADLSELVNSSKPKPDSNAPIGASGRRNSKISGQ